MRDDQHGATVHQSPDRGEDRRFRLRVDRARRLVQDEDRAVLQESAGKGDALALAARKLPTALADLCVIAAREPDDEIVGVRSLRRGNDRVAADPVVAVRDVLGDARGEEHRILQHDRELPAEILQLVIAEVDAVEQDRTGCRVVEAHEQVHQGALSRAGRAHNPQPCAGCNVERDIVQNGTILSVTERDVPEGDVPAGPHQRLRAGPLFDIGWFVEHGEAALNAGKYPCTVATFRLMVLTGS